MPSCTLTLTGLLGFTQVAQNSMLLDIVPWVWGCVHISIFLVRGRGTEVDIRRAGKGASPREANGQVCERGREGALTLRVLRIRELARAKYFTLKAYCVRAYA